jgi:ribosomal protein L16 Arg81 hydroxylase
MMNLADILFPVRLDDFFTSYWTEKALHVPGKSDKFSSIVSLAAFQRDLDQQIDSYQFPKLEFLLNGESVPFDMYSHIVEMKKVERQRKYSRDAVNRLCAEGYTLTMRRVDQLNADLSGLRARLEQELLETVNMNAYLSHPSAFGFHPHYDTHEVLALQVAGKKQWKLYGTNHTFPLATQPSKGRKTPQKSTVTVELSPGDVLYLPRGMWHSAQTIGSSSFHITIGIHCEKRIDRIHKQMAKDPLWRKNARSAKDFLQRSDKDFSNGMAADVDWGKWMAKLNAARSEEKRVRDTPIDLGFRHQAHES